MARRRNWQGLLHCCLVLSVLTVAYSSLVGNTLCTAAHVSGGGNSTDAACAAARASKAAAAGSAAPAPASAEAVSAPGMQDVQPAAAAAAAEEEGGAGLPQGGTQQQQQQQLRRARQQQQQQHLQAILDAAAEVAPAPPAEDRGSYLTYLLFVSELEQLPRHLKDPHFRPVVAPVLPPRLLAGDGQQQQQQHHHHHHQPAGEVLALIAKHRPQFLVSVGPEGHFGALKALPAQFRALWTHLPSPAALTPAAVEGAYLAALSAPPGGPPGEPLLSLFTPAYKSGWKIHIPYESLLAQTYQNWEWVIYDDSPPSHTATWAELSALRDADPRVKVIRTDRNDGYIGNVKSKSCAAATGQLLIELDHDDELTADGLEVLRDAYLANPDAAFFYGETVELYEGSTDTVDYGALFAVGWGVHYRMLMDGEWVTGTFTPPPTECTLRHIVGVPNHVRVWRRDAYLAMGGHSRGLPVADDYDLILRTYFEYPSVYLRHMHYVQYRQKDGSTFTFKRNALIQRLVNIISERQGRNIHRFLAANNRSDIGRAARWTLHLVEANTTPTNASLSRFYHKPTAEAPPERPHVTVIIPTRDNTEGLLRAVRSVYAQDYDNWELLIMGDKCPQLVAFMEEHKQMFIDGNRTVRYYNMHKHEGLQGPLNAATKALAASDWMAYLADNATWAPDHLSTLAAAYAADRNVSFVFGSFTQDGKTVTAGEPQLGKLQTSAVMHHRRLIEEYGGWAGQDDGLADSWELFSRWTAAAEPWGASLKPTVHLGAAPCGPAAAGGGAAPSRMARDEL